ncbi:hypothetical protein GIB67_019261 [Kingdonia uniflora]|uniref:AP2/ERF domain-containing protein n=1 Tax=Kingdonia uniflora TaxID=39325 RepID=A0A7J7N0G6_9MAGN|nr:hypothetical protein GIB67_019261 [Kingdonia uniflora]
MPDPDPAPSPDPLGVPAGGDHQQPKPCDIDVSFENQSPRAKTPVTSPTSSGKHPIFRGIRCRGGKWVSEIREPRKTTRIWLGTYPTPEMAAAAYDVAALTLKGSDVVLNFPDSRLSYQMPASASATHIRAAAGAAAALRQPKVETGEGSAGEKSTMVVASVEEFMDEEAIFYMPTLLVNMAEAMLVSPPRINTAPSDESSGSSEGERLWSYDLNNECSK